MCADACPCAHTARTGVFAVELPAPRERYESALVFLLPEPATQWICALRAEFDLAAPPEHQLIPHMTLLYLGHMSGTDLLEVQQQLAVLAAPAIQAVPTRFGTFRRDGRVCNVHVRMESAAVQGLHARALGQCESLPWFSRRGYVGDRYTPHVSVCDRIDVPDEDLRLPEFRPPLPVFALERLRLFVKPLGPSA